MTVNGMIKSENGLSDMVMEIINNGKQIFIGKKEQMSVDMLELEIIKYSLCSDKIVFEVSNS